MGRWRWWRANAVLVAASGLMVCGVLTNSAWQGALALLAGMALLALAVKLFEVPRG